MLIALGPGQPIPAINSHVTRSSSSSFSECDSYPVTRIWIPLYFIFIFKVHQSYTVDNYCTTPVPHLSRQPSSLRHFGWTIKPFTQLDFCHLFVFYRKPLIIFKTKSGLGFEKLESDKMIHMLGCPICQVLFVQHTHLDFQRIEKSFFISWFHDYESYVLSRVLIV